MINITYRDKKELIGEKKTVNDLIDPDRRQTINDHWPDMCAESSTIDGSCKSPRGESTNDIDLEGGRPRLKIRS